MKIKSLGLKTDLMILKNESIIKDHGDYISVITPDHLSFHWGNHLIYPEGPVKGVYEKWISDFKTCFKHFKVKHMAFTWDINKNPSFDYSEFEKNGFKYDDTTSLTTKKLNINYQNNTINMQTLSSEEDWKKVIDFQIAVYHEISKNADEWRDFYEKRLFQYRKLVHSGLGRWYIARINNKIVADLGLFWQEGVARYQLVTTHKEYRRMGIAQTLIKFASEDSKCSLFIIEADNEGAGINLYQSIGFKIQGKRGGLLKITESCLKKNCRSF